MVDVQGLKMTVFFEQDFVDIVGCFRDQVYFGTLNVMGFTTLLDLYGISYM